MNAWFHKGLFALTAAAVLASWCSSAAPPSASWPKSFYDEFSGAGLDPAKWSFGSLPWGGQHHTADYASYITPQDSYVTNGSLFLRCRTAVGSEFGGYPYSEGFAHSNGKMNYTYGYVEIRGRFPLGRGTWPAFWSLSSGWPPEFDIAEFFGSDARMHMGLAYGTGTWDSSNFYESSGEAFENFHTYALEWGPGYAIWYKDGNLKKSIYQSYVPSAPMYVMLNSGMRWDATNAGPVTNYFEVDYFRKYDAPAAVVNDNTIGTGMNQFNYAGAWSFGGQAGAFFDDNHWSSALNAYYTIQFNGTRLDLYGARNSNHGIAAVSIDGGAENLVDFYAAARSDKALLWSASGLVFGTHTLKVRVTGTKNAASSGTAIIADRVDVWTGPTSLAGASIGTGGSFNNAGNTREKAMDGDLNSFFDAPIADGAWVGLDLGLNLKKITRVLYCPRSGYAVRMVGGKFQGANVADFTGAIDLFTITNSPDEGTMTTQSITVTNSFRYVRYLAPAAGFGNIAEVEFYGVDGDAANGVWISDTDGNWSDTAKWSSGTIGTGAGFAADFSTLNITNNRMVTLDTSRSIGTLKFGDISSAQTWTLAASGGSLLTLDTGSGVSPAIVVNQNSAIVSAPLAGANGFTKSGTGTLILAGDNPLSGILNVDTGSTSSSDGTLQVSAPAALANVASPIYIRNNNNGSSTFQIDGSSGTIALVQDIALSGRNSAVVSIRNLAGTNILAGDLFINVGGGNYWLQSDSGLLTFSGALYSVAAGTRTFTFQGNGDVAVSGVISNGTAATLNLVKLGAGRLILSGTNTFTGTTAINGGTLLVNGAVGPGGVTLANSTLGGNGVISGPVNVQAGATLAPGTSPGRLTVSNSVMLAAGSTTRMEISRLPLTNDSLAVSGSLNYGGTLAVTNLAGTLAAGDSFKLFSAASYAGSFAVSNLPPLASALGWNFIATNGTLTVVTTMATNPTNLDAIVSGTTVTLAWPADHVGWRLESNAVSIADNTAWFTVPGSSGTNRWVLPINPATPSVFFRLAF